MFPAIASNVQASTAASRKISGQKLPLRKGKGLQRIEEALTAASA